jgi:hypothetical protein
VTPFILSEISEYEVFLLLKCLWHEISPQMFMIAL